MSSAETLNFGPQWLRDLSGSSSTSLASTQFSHTSKFKLAENRYGREEMLSLFVDDSEIPEELTRAPSLVSEFIQVPLALRTSPDSNQSQLSGGFRGRGGVSTGLRGRSIPSRGRGRGRGTPWDHEDGAVRKPMLRRADSEDWRSDSLRGKGDGAEDHIMGGLKEWRATGQRNDFWKDTWRDRPGDVRDQNMFRSRSVSAKENEDSNNKFWQDDLNHPKDTTKYSKFSASFESSEKDKEKHKDEEKNSNDNPPLQPDVDKPCNGDLHKHPPSEPQNSVLPEKLKKSLKTLSEVNEPPGATHVEHKISSLQPTIKETDGDPRRIPFEENKTSLFQNFPIHDSGGVLADSSITSYFQVQEKLKTESQPVPNEAVTLPFTSNSVIGSRPTFSNTPTSSSSPIAQLQQLATTWFYKDPQGDVQGPFSSTQMMEWFNAGYFTMVLLVKRACDTEFLPLGELIKSLGQVPFTSAPNTVLQDRPSYENNTPAMNQPNFTSDQQKLQYLKIQEQTQQPKPSAIGSSRPTPPKQLNLEAVVAKLMTNQDFLRMSTQQRQHIVMQYMDEIKRRSISSDVQNSTFPSTTASEPSRTVPDSINFLSNQTTVSNPLQQQQTEYLYQQKLLQEKARKEEEEIRRIQKQQEEQKELLKREEEEYKRRKEMLRREQEEMERLQQETQRKKEELQRKLVEEERLKKVQEMKEMEKRKKIEEERLKELQERDAEQRRIREVEDLKRKQEETEQRRRMELEETMRRLEQQRQAEMKKMEIEKEERRIQEEKRRQEDIEKQMEKEAELQRRMEAAKIQREREAEAKHQLKIRQQEQQMQQIQLPSSARWGQQQQYVSHSDANDSLSLKDIQEMEKEFEQTRIQEETRIAKETRYQQPQKSKPGWSTTSAESTSGMSLLDIQREEAKQMGTVIQQPYKPEKISNLGLNTLWNRPPKIQVDVPKPQPKLSQPSFWDQVVEESPKKPAPTVQNKSKQQPKKGKQSKASKKFKGDEGQQVKAIFQQQITKDGFTEWCESYLEKMSVGSIDIPTFVNFLRDVESPYEVQEYVQSYLGESREVKDFTNLFLEQRSNFGGFKYNSQQSKVESKSHSSGSRDTDGFEIVTGNAKRGKKKLKKSQKIDPSILGFSVNAASNRVNMGEIQTADE